jgi:D-threo-aldose 1-dehydrogenase
MLDPTERVQLGRTGVTVTRMGLGTAALGGLFRPVSEEQARATIEAAWEAGLRYFDTAPLYGYGLAERRLGEVLRGRPRDAFCVSTKVGRLLRSGLPHHPTEFDDRGALYYQGAPDLSLVYDYSYDGAMRSFEESLDRLGLNRVDVLLIHDPDVVQLADSPEAHFRLVMEGAYRALRTLRDQGVVRAIGVGMNRVEMLVQFARGGEFDVFLVAGRYTLLDQVALRELLPLCLERRIAVVIGGVYNSGILVDPRPGATFDYVRATPALLERARRLAVVCGRWGVPLRAAAIQFPLGHPAVVSVLSGSRSPAELEENVAMFRYEIPDGLWDDLIAEGLLPPDAPVPRRVQGGLR